MDKLPVWATVGRAYGFAFGNLGLLVKGLWIWFVLYLGTVFGVWLYAGTSGDLTDSLAGLITQLAIVYVVMVVTSIAAAIFTHRVILLGWRPSSWLSFSLGGRDLRYLGFGVLLFLICLLAAVPAWFVVNSLAQLVWLAVIAPLLVGLATFLMSVRFMIKFPAVAVDNIYLTLADSWVLTTGNTWRLWLGLSLSTVPAYLVVQIISESATVALMLGQLFISNLFGSFAAIVMLLGIVIGAAFLSHAYRHFVPKTTEDGAGTPAEPIA